MNGEGTRAPSPWRLGWRLARYLPTCYFPGGLVWIGFYTLPIATGLVLQRLFDLLGDGLPTGTTPALWLCAALIAVEVVRGGLLWFMLNLWALWWNGVATLLRSNVLRSLLGAPGPAATRLPGSTGEAVSRFRDDVEDLVIMTDIWIDVAGSTVFAVTAFAIMWSIDPLVTVVLVLPLTAAIVATRALGDLIKRWHGRARVLGAGVTAFVGDLFGGVLAVKTTGAEDAILARLRRLNDARRDAAVRDRLALDLLDTVTGATVEVSIGLVLLLAAPAMSRGDFTVGDFALFVTYAGWLTMFPRLLGRGMYRVRQGAVAAERLAALLTPDQPAGDLVDHRPVWLRSAPPPEAPPTPVLRGSDDRHGRHGPDSPDGPDGRADRHDRLDGRDPDGTGPDERVERLEVLEVDGLVARHRGSDRGIVGADLRLERGSFTVVTGAVGAGKTTLIRALLGLLPRQAGTIRWNGRVVDDPGRLLIPPVAAYAGQVPRLFSATLRENLLLGWPETAVDVAVHLAALEHDVAAMPTGLDTMVGPRGVRLSGGQVQRATAARALVRTPDLLVVDDLSSALDVETEELLWARLAEAADAGTGPTTLLVVSHRAAALRRADQVVVLDRGRVAAAGPLARPARRVRRDAPALGRGAGGRGRGGAHGLSVRTGVSMSVRAPAAALALARRTLPGEGVPCDRQPTGDGSNGPPTGAGTPSPAGWRSWRGGRQPAKPAFQPLRGGDTRLEFDVVLVASDLHETDLDAERLLEQPLALLGGVELERRVVVAGVDLDDELAGARPWTGGSHPDVPDHRLPAAVEGDRDAQQPGQHPNGVLIAGAEPGELDMPRLGRALAVVPGDEGDDLDLVVGEADQHVGVADDVVRVLVVSRVGDEQPDIGQQPGGLEQLLVLLAQPVQLARGVEQREGETGGVFGVGAFPGAMAARWSTLRRRRSPSW